MKTVWLVGMGGFLGSILRYGLVVLVARFRTGWSFPLETLVINVIGCLVLGILAGISETRGVLAGTTRAFLFVGLLGGFSTFSAFGDETFRLLRDGQWPVAMLSAGLQVVLGIGAVWAGHVVARAGS